MAPWPSKPPLLCHLQHQQPGPSCQCKRCKRWVRRHTELLSRTSLSEPASWPLQMDLHDTEKPDAKRQKQDDEYSHEEAIVIAAAAAPPQQPIPVMTQPEPVQQPPQQQQSQPVVVEQRPPPPPVPIPQPMPQQPVQVQQPMQQQPMQQPQPQQPQASMQQQQQQPLQQPMQQALQQPMQSTADSRPLPADVSMAVSGLTTLATAPTEYWRQQATAALPTAKPPTSIDSHPSTTVRAAVLVLARLCCWRTPRCTRATTCSASCQPQHGKSAATCCCRTAVRLCSTVAKPSHVRFLTAAVM
jgi:outer membrane biosynthesis protein TonB